MLGDSLVTEKLVCVAQSLTLASADRLVWFQCRKVRKLAELAKSTSGYGCRSADQLMTSSKCQRLARARAKMEGKDGGAPAPNLPWSVAYAY